MKPNDKAYAAARKVAYNRINKCFVFDLIKEAVDAAYAAQFPPSEDYAELIETLRSSSPYTLSHVAADAIEAVLAERDALKAELAKARSVDMTWFWEIVDKNGLSNVPSSEGDALRKLVRDSAILDGLRARFGNIGEGDGQFTVESTFQALLNVIDFNVELTGKLTAAEEERDALLARLAPVDDKELVEIAADAISTYVPNQVSKWGSIKDAAIDAIAAVRPHIEAAERERCAAALEITSDEIRLHAGEMTAQEMRSVLAVLAWRAAAIRSGK